MNEGTPSLSVGYAVSGTFSGSYWASPGLNVRGELGFPDPTDNDWSFDFRLTTRRRESCAVRASVDMVGASDLERRENRVVGEVEGEDRLLKGMEKNR